MRRRKPVPEAFCSDLFMELEKQETTLDVGEDFGEDYYKIGDNVSLTDGQYQIIDIDYETKLCTLSNNEFPLSSTKMDFENVEYSDSGPKRFYNRSRNPYKPQPKAEEEDSNIQIDDYIGQVVGLHNRLYKIVSEKESNVIVEDMTVSQSKLVLLNPQQLISKKDVIPLLKKIDLTKIAKDTEQAETSTPAPAPTDSSSSVIHTNINFKLDEEDSYRTIGERITDNLNAIKVLKELEEQNKNAVEKISATPEQREILSKYSGWGGLTEIFEPEKNNSHRSELLDILSAEEYQSASTSQLDAYYTPNKIIKSIYKMLMNNGFENGMIIEPSCGAGRFFGLMPEKMRKSSTMIGVELDTITAGIAAYLYPEVTIRNKGYEKVFYGKNTFDLAITNVPFGDYEVNDATYNKYKWNIHDYFISRMIDQVRPGGIVVAITSSFSLDKQKTTAREYWAHRAELISAIRLPNSTFKNTHTQVVCDVLIFKKRQQYVDDITDCDFIESDYLELDGVRQKTNQYFIKNKDNVIGEFKKISGPHGDRLTVEGNVDDFSALMEKINFTYSAERQKIEQNSIDVPKELIELAEYSYCSYEGKLYFKSEGRLHLITPKYEKQKERIYGLIKLRDVYNQLVNAMEESNQNAAKIYTLQQNLNYAYENFVRKNGRICSVGNSRAFSDDLKYANLCSLEIYDDEGNFTRKSDIFTQITIKKKKTLSAENEADALQISIAEKGKIDFDFMQMLTSMSKTELIEKLTSDKEIFKIPFTNDCYESKETYLSGYVKKKLTIAKAAAESDETYKGNVEALEAVQPKDIQANEIFAPLGTSWIPCKYYEDFIEFLFKTSKISVVFVNENYHLSQRKYRNVPCESTYGTIYCNALRLFEDALNLRNTKIYKKVYVNGEKTKVIDKEKTQVVQAMQEQIKLAWLDWVFKDYERRTELVRIYNDTMNDLVPTHYDGTKIKFDGMASNIELMPHQKNAVARIVRNGNTLLAHKVGFGKSATRS